MLSSMNDDILLFSSQGGAIPIAPIQLVNTSAFKLKLFFSFTQRSSAYLVECVTKNQIKKKKSDKSDEFE